MKWIKALDKLPDPLVKLSLKIDGKPAWGYYQLANLDNHFHFESYFGFGALFSHQWEDVEWLDETPTTESQWPTEEAGKDLLEKFAELAHSQWSGWMEYLFSKGELNTDGTFTIAQWAVKRWTKQSKTEYKDLSESEQESDRTEARKFLNILQSSVPIIPGSSFSTEAVEAFKSCVTLIEELLDREIIMNWSGLGKAHAALQWLRTSGVREGTREGELRDALEEIANLNPYPEDVFLPVSDELLKDIHKLLMKTYSIPIDRLSGHIGRLLLKGIQTKAKSLLSKTI